MHVNKAPATSANGSAIKMQPLPTKSGSRSGSQESIVSSNHHQQIHTTTKRTDSQTTIIDSGYGSNSFRPSTSVIVEEPALPPRSTRNDRPADSRSPRSPIYENFPPRVEFQFDPSSYEHFISDYLSTHGKHRRSSKDTLILAVDEQLIPMPHIRLSSNEHFNVSKQLYAEAIDRFPVPFETTLDQLVVFVAGESIVLPASRWLTYRKQYKDTAWVRQLQRMNQQIPSRLLPEVEQWLAQHTTFSPDGKELNVDGLAIPLRGTLGTQVSDLYRTHQSATNHWSEIFTYLIRMGYVNYDARKQVIHIANSELDVRLLLKSPTPELIERVAQRLRSLDHIHFHRDNGSLIISDGFIIPNEYVHHLIRQDESLNADELAGLLLRLCDFHEEAHDDTLVLTFRHQTLCLRAPGEDRRDFYRKNLFSLLQSSTFELVDQRRLRMTHHGNAQSIEFNEADTKILHDDLQMDVSTCTDYLMDHLLDSIDYDHESDSLLLTYHQQTFQSKTIKETSARKKLRLVSNLQLDDNHMEILIQWLDQLDRQQLIEINGDYDIALCTNQEGEIFIHHDDVRAYMATKGNRAALDRLSINDIAHILLRSNVVRLTSNQFTVGNQVISRERNELQWLQSIIRQVRAVDSRRETEIELFDGEHTQVLQVSYTDMSPTKDRQLVAEYLMRHGNIRYDGQTGNYAYRYIAPEAPPMKRVNSVDHQSLSSHIRQIHLDKGNRTVEVEFVPPQNPRLRLPSTWYDQVAAHHFERAFIVDMLLSHGGTIDRDAFKFNNQSYRLSAPAIPAPKARTSPQEKQKLIDHYVEYVNNQGGVNFDNNSKLLLLENPTDGSKLFLTAEHTQFMRENQYRRQDLKYLLNKHSQLKRDEFNNWLLLYNDQCLQIPPLSPSTGSGEPKPRDRLRSVDEAHVDLLDRYHATMDHMYNHGLISYNPRSKLVLIQFANEDLSLSSDQLRSIIDTQPNGTVLPFRSSHQLSQWLLEQSDTIASSRQGTIEIIYRNKPYQLPVVGDTERSSINPLTANDSSLKLLFPFNRSLRLIQKSASTTTLDVQPPTAANGYATDPLLILANYIYRAATIYQDVLGRLVIKMNDYEIVIPRIESTSAIEAINASAQRTGTIIARLIARIGRVESNQRGGLLITVGRRSFELPKESIDRANQFRVDEDLSRSKDDVRARPRQASTQPLLRQSRSASNLLSSNDQSWSNGSASRLDLDYRRFIENNPQRSVSINDLTRLEQSNQKRSRRAPPPELTSQRPRLLVMHDKRTASSSQRQTRFYVQYAQETKSIAAVVSPVRSLTRPSQPQLITPDHYRDSKLREASVTSYGTGDGEIFYENIPQYLLSDERALSSRAVRRMLEFSSSDEYFVYLTDKIPLNDATQLVGESEVPTEESSTDYMNVSTRMTGSREGISTVGSRREETRRSTEYLYDVQQDSSRRAALHPSSRYRFPDRSSSTSSLDSDMVIANASAARRIAVNNR